ncbi:hypothetical protein BKA70DRAFT_1323653 [Coprinopsis sp. MPI-PUGE-AT-0042]|nr:hypothetical protein BKA70DRAFT_1323653 [Coprinopsis sp. MPI-PUGE-AT-0042]
MSSSTQDYQKHQTSNPYEARFGYSRAVRKGPFIFEEDITRIRMFVTHDEDTTAVGNGYEGGVRFVDEKMRVEIEADAVVL